MKIRAFACSVALDVAHLWPMPVLVRLYLETQDEEKREEAHILSMECVHHREGETEYEKKSAVNAWSASLCATGEALDPKAETIVNYAVCAFAYACRGGAEEKARREKQKEDDIRAYGTFKALNEIKRRAVYYRQKQEEIE